MNYVRGLFFATFISLMIASIFSFFPQADLINSSNTETTDRPVFSVRKPIELVSDNLVSFFKQLPAVYPFNKVKLDGDELFIDSKIDTEHRFQPEAVYHDTYQILKHLYFNTTNVQNIYLRFLYEADDQVTLVLSVQAQREQVEEGLDLSTEDLKMERIEQLLNTVTRMEYGTGWRK